MTTIHVRIPTGLTGDVFITFAPDEDERDGGRRCYGEEQRCDQASQRGDAHRARRSGSRR